MLSYPLFAWLYVWLRVEVRWRGIRRPTFGLAFGPHVITSIRQVMPLITLIYLLMLSVNHCDMLRIIWWNLIGFPSFVYPTPCRQMNYGVDLILLYLVLGLMLHLNYWSCSNFAVVLIIVHDKIIVLIGTWSLTWDNNATTRMVWDALGWLIRKASGWLPYPKGARAVGELSV
jgi:hypothetical protein